MADSTNSLYETQIAGLDGAADALSAAKGKVTLLVNVASQCGLTPQYEQLVDLQRKYGDEKFTVMGVPCNQFGEQEPGSAEEISTFCSTNYGVTFPMTEKVEVNGDGRHALYSQLTPLEDNEGHTGDIRWNFEKFLIGSDGAAIARYSPTVIPDDALITAAIESAVG